MHPKLRNTKNTSNRIENIQIPVLRIFLIWQKQGFVGRVPNVMRKLISKGYVVNAQNMMLTENLSNLFIEFV